MTNYTIAGTGHWKNCTLRFVATWYQNDDKTVTMVYANDQRRNFPDKYAFSEHVRMMMYIDQDEKLFTIV